MNVSVSLCLRNAQKFWREQVSFATSRSRSVIARILETHGVAPYAFDTSETKLAFSNRNCFRVFFVLVGTGVANGRNVRHGVGMFVH